MEAPIRTVRIAPADLEDVRVCALLLHHAATARAQSPAQSAHALDLDGLRGADIQVFALWEGDALAAVGALRRFADGAGELKAMHTAQAWRGRGQGAAMLAHLLDVARRDGLARVSLETGSQPYFEPARSLYRRQGFVACEPFADYRPDPNSTFMTLGLG